MSDKYYSAEGKWFFDRCIGETKNGYIGSIKIYSNNAIILEVFLEVQYDKPLLADEIFRFSSAYAYTDIGRIDLTGLDFAPSLKFPGTHKERISKFVFRIHSAVIHHQNIQLIPREYCAINLDSKLLKSWYIGEEINPSFGSDSVKIPRGKWISVDIDKIQGEANFGWSYGRGNNGKTFKISKHGFLSIEYSKPQTIYSVIRDSDIMSDFMYTVTGIKFVPKIKITPYHRDKDLRGFDSQLIRWDGKLEKKVNSMAYNLLFKFEDLENELSVALNSWFEMYDTLMPIFKIIESMSFWEKLGNATAFLKFAQMAETLHDRLYSEYVMEQAQFRPLKRKIKRLYRILVSGEIKENIDNSIEFAYKKSFRKKIEVLITEELLLLFPHLPSRKYAIDKITASRNYFTHLQDRDKDRAAIDGELVYLAHLLEYAIKFNILKTIGISDNKIIEKMKNYYLIEYVNQEYKDSLERDKRVIVF